MTETTAPLRYIETEEALAAWVRHCERADVLAVDTESDSFHHYREKVCLVQMTVLGVDAIIDPLALGSLEPLRGVLEDPSRVKIFHDAGYDLLCLKRDYGFELAGLFDTMLASRLLGHKHFGLAAILRERYGFEADKRLQRSDWAQRPLSDAQIQYARYDTHFLAGLADSLARELEAAGRIAWAQADFARLPEIAQRAAPRSNGPDPNGFWRVKGVKAMSPEVLGRVRALHLVREQLAQQLDRPAFKIFGDDVLIELAKYPPRSRDDLTPRPGLRRAGVDRFGKDIWHALQSATPVHESAPKGATRRRRPARFMDPDARDRYDDLRELRRSIAEQLNLDPEVALGNAPLEELARNPPKRAGEIAKLPDFSGWRGDLFVGPLEQALVHGKWPRRARPKPEMTAEEALNDAAERDDEADGDAE